MSDNLDIRGRLSLDNDLSPEMRRVVEDIKRFEKQIERLKKSFERPIKGSIVDPKVLGEVQETLGQTGKKFNRLTKDQMAWAREQKRIGQLTTDTWLGVVTHIDGTVDKFNKATGAKRKALARQLKDDIGYARAFRYVYQGENDRYIRSLERRDQAEARLKLMQQKRDDALARARARAQDKEAKAQARDAERKARDAKRQADEAAREVRRQNRLREREERLHQENLVRARRQVFRGINRLGDFGSGMRGAGLGTAVSAGGAILAARSAIRASTTVDTEKAYAQIFQGISKEQAEKLYREWAIPTGAKMGVRPSELMRTANEGVQHGVPDELAAGYAERVTKMGKQLRVDIPQLSEALGPMLAQLKGKGRLKTLDDAERLMNLATVMANQSAATREGIISAMRTGFGATDLLGMDEAHGMALLTTLIEGGSQGQQAARGVGHMAQRLYKMPLHAKDIRRKEHKSAEDRLFLAAPEKLGFGSFEEISRRFKQDPNKFPFEFLQRFNRISDLQERGQLFFALMGQDFARFELNVIKMTENIQRNIKLANDAVGEEPGKNQLARGFDIFLTTWESIQERISAMWEPIIADFGDGFKDFANDFMEVFGDFSKKLTGNLRKCVEEFGRGLITGFGFSSLKDMLRYLMPESGVSPDSFFKFGKGLAEGIKSIGSAIASAGSMIIKAFGGNPESPEALGKLVGQITALVVALGLLSPVIAVFASIVTIINGLTAALTGLAATTVGRFLLSRIGGPAAAVAIATDPRSNSASDVTSLQEELKKEREKNKALGLDKETRKKLRQLQNYKTPKEADPFFTPTSYTGPTDFSGRRRSSVDELADQLRKFGGTVERAAFISSAMGGFSRYSSSSGGFTSSVPTPMAPSIGSNASALLSSTPGGALPDLGIPQSGSIIKRSNIPSFGGQLSSSGGLNRGAYDKMFAGTPMAGMYDHVVNAAKANNLDPSLLAAVMAHESAKGKVLSGNNPGGVMDPATGWSRKMQFNSLGDGIDKTASVLKKNFDRAGGSIDALGGIYAPRGAANDPNGLNKYWPGNVSKLREQLADTGVAGAAAGVEPGLADKLGLRGKANFMHGQYGAPGQNMTTITTASGKKLTVNAAAAESFKGFVDELEASGYKINSLEGYSHRGKRGGGGWSQHAYGNAIDINPAKNPYSSQFKTDLPSNVRDMAAKYGLSWGGDWKSIKDTMHFEWNGTQPWKNVPIPSDAVKNVPAPTPIPGGGGGGSKTIPGNVAIHINGNSHDPEALATLVQRRIDESMNWRTHDSESEYT